MTRALAFALCLAAVPAFAFEGLIETKMTLSSSKMSESGGPRSVSGTGTISLKGLNSRMEQQMTLPGVGGPVKQVVIHRADEPNTTYILHEQNKTYQKLTSEKGERDDSAASKWKVKKLGKDTIAGRSTEHVQVTHEGRGDVMDVWIDKNLVSSGDLEKAFSASEGQGGGWWQALKKEGVAGIPLKVVASTNKGEGGVTWEATSVKPQSVPDSAFKIPSGYTESKASGGSMTPEQQQQVRQQMMERLTPEQRKQVEEMMKQHEPGK
jgi:P pilus assembly/Cpx signaling pathway, periplasmic inhibitor/zinc-resistance associated protein